MHHKGTRWLLGLVLSGWLFPITAVTAQELTASESEAYTMTQDFSFGCDPRRLSDTNGSSSALQYDSGEHLGGADFKVEAGGGLALIAGSFDGETLRCLVLTSPSLPEMGAHDVEMLSPKLRESDPGEYAGKFFAAMFVSGGEGGTIYVVESGSVDLEKATPDRLQGRVALRGFEMRDDARTGDFEITGTFDAPARGASG